MVLVLSILGSVACEFIILFWIMLCVVAVRFVSHLNMECQFFVLLSDQVKAKLKLSHFLKMKLAGECQLFLIFSSVLV